MIQASDLRVLMGTESPFSPIHDETLGVRPNPDHPEHDSRGYRNEGHLHEPILSHLAIPKPMGLEWRHIMHGPSS